MLGIVTANDIATNSFYQPNLLRRDSAVYSLGFAAKIERFDLCEITLPSPQEGIRLGPVYATVDEMRYGPRWVDEAGLERIRTARAQRSSLAVSPASLE
jgi:hypothetical protein